ncbi:MAG: FAD-dependent monooxygenase [Nitratireductor sp.]
MTSAGYNFNLLPETGHKRPAFINLQQYHFEKFLVDRCRQLQSQGKPLEIRGNSRVADIRQQGGFVSVDVETPKVRTRFEADWLLACDGANSLHSPHDGTGFVGRVFEDNFLIADVVMEADFSYGTLVLV